MIDYQKIAEAQRFVSQKGWQANDTVRMNGKVYLFWGVKLDGELEFKTSNGKIITAKITSK